MEAFFIGLFTILIGLGLTFAGYQFFRVLIPLWGFFAGFSWGAQALAIGMGTGFLTTLFGWTVGIVVGLVIAALAYFFYELAVGVLAGFLGYWLTGSLLLTIGFDPGFFVSFLATGVGLVLAVVAVALKAPKGLLIFLTGLGGATMTIAGILVLFGVLPVAALGIGLVDAIIGQSFLWTMIWIGLAFVGMVSQAYMSGAVSNIEETYYYPYGTAGMKGGEATRDTDDETSDTNK